MRAAGRCARWCGAARAVPRAYGAAQAYWIAFYRSVKNPDALAAYAKLAGPAIEARLIDVPCVVRRVCVCVCVCARARARLI